MIPLAPIRTTRVDREREHRAARAGARVPVGHRNYTELAGKFTSPDTWNGVITVVATLITLLFNADGCVQAREIPVRRPPGGFC